MNKPKVSIICACSENRGIGLKGKMLWCISEDLKNFRNLIEGHCIIIGRKTFQSIGKTFIDRKKIIVLSRDNYVAKNCIMASSIEDAIAKARKIEKEEIFICGGGSVYAQMIDLVDKLYLTVVKRNFEADTFFPEHGEFKKVISEKESSEGDYGYKFLELEK